MTPVRQAFILGGGPCGLAMADELSAAGVRVRVIEADKDLGGLARTIRWGASRMDLGPHKLFSLNRALVDKVRAKLPVNDWLTHEKHAEIFLNGHFLHYPPSPLDLTRAFGFMASAKCGWDYARALMNGSSRSPATAEEDVRGRLGHALYERMFLPIALKIWGEPSTLDPRLSKGRVQVPTLTGLLKSFLRAPSDWHADTYFYPKGGLSVFWNSLAASIRRRGGEISLGDPVDALRTDGKSVTAIRTRGGQEWTVDPHTDWVLSTVPLARLGKMMPTPPAIADAISSLRLNDLLLVYLKTTEDVVGKNSWYFIPDESILFHRVSDQRKFDPGLVEPGVHLLCCEVIHYDGKESTAQTDERLIERCVQDVIRLGKLTSAAAVKDARVIRIPSTYPVLTVNYDKNLKTILDHFDAFENLRTAGRQGAFNYIGTLDAIDIGYGLARRLLDNEIRAEAWRRERERTSFYPVLD